MMYTSGIQTMLSRTIRTHLQVKQETKVHFLVGTMILGFLPIFKKSKASSPFEALNSVCLSSCQSDMIPPVQMRRKPMVSLGSPQGIQTSLHLVTWNTSLNLSHCRDIWPSFESGLSQYISLETESRDPLSYMLLRENSTWAACGKLAQLFSQRQGISSHLETICCAWNFLHAAVLKWVFI